MNDTRPEMMSDADLDRLLQAASRIDVPLGAQGRVMAKLASRNLPNTNSRGWYLAVPLAASLMLGVYLGAAGYADMLTTESDSLDVAGFESGLEEVEAAAEEDST